MDLFAMENTQEIPFALPKIEGYSVEWDESLKGFCIKVPNGELFYSERFFSKKISDRALEYFLENDKLSLDKTNWREISDEEFSKVEFKNIKWKRDSIKLYGKSIPLPRYTSWYGDKGRDYTYSGIKSAPNEWNKGLLYFKEQVEKVAGSKFNSVLMNWYRDGKDYLNWHADDEKELGRNPIIASVNFGATRDFIIRKNDKSQKISIPLGHGTLLIMKGELQHFWQHSVPKRANVNESRFNLTFRTIL
ncbi:MAG: alpha-ketoglutarate-dependent dioxygenase AlkB [Thiothrix sp.]|nr:MAG: alpha-ketoglutarate-dependent dioxygenase AlkB [Thiothrix sp.]